MVMPFWRVSKEMRACSGLCIVRKGSDSIISYLNLHLERGKAKAIIGKEATVIALRRGECLVFVVCKSWLLIGLCFCL